MWECRSFSLPGFHPGLRCGTPLGCRTPKGSNTTARRESPGAVVRQGAIALITPASLCLAAVLVLAIVTPSSQASISFDAVTWGNGGDTLGWHSTGGVATVTSPALGGNPDGYVNAHFAVGAPPGPTTDAIVSTNEGYIGNYAGYNGLTLRFDYLGYSEMAQSLFFTSTAGGGSTWAYNLTVPAHNWTGYQVSFANPSGWTRLSGASDFATALTQVDMIGLTILNSQSLTTFDYGLDNWQYFQGYVPEPGSLALGLTGLLSVGMTFRRSLAGAARRLLGRKPGDAPPC